MDPPCALHPGRIAVATCARCQRPICDLCASVRFGETRCPACAEIGIPWEQPGLNPVAAYFKTAFGALFDPERLFSSPIQSQGLGVPFRYDLITQYIGASVPTVATAMSYSSETMRTALGLLHFTALTPHQLAVATLASYPLTGLVLALCNLGLAGLMHLTLRVLGTSQGGFQRTYAAAAYGSSGALLNITYFLQFLFIPQLWQAFSTVTALRHAQQTTTSKATAAVVVPDLAILLILFSVIGYYVMRGVQTLLGQSMPI